MKTKKQAAKRGAGAVKALALLILAVILASAFSIFTVAAETAPTLPPSYADAASGNPDASGFLTPIVETVYISEIPSGTDVVAWIYCPNGIAAAFESRILFGKDGQSMLPPYPGSTKLIAYGNYLALFYSALEWETLVNGAYAPDRVSFYAAIGFPYPQAYHCGVSAVSEFVHFFEQQQYDSGYATGNVMGYDSGYEKGKAKGESEGYDKGFGVGQTLGYNNGYTEGNETGYKSGYSKGYATGEDTGYNKGFDAGEKHAIDTNESIQGGIVGGVIQGVWNGLHDAWNTISSIETIGGLTLGGILGTIVIAVVAAFIVKIFKK